jgi:hypothetical protein
MTALPLIPRLPGTITPRRSQGTPAGQPTPGELDPESFVRCQHEIVDRWCQHRDSDDGPCLALCASCRDAANVAINAAYATRNRMALANDEHLPRGNLVGRIEVVDPDSEKGRRIIAARAERIVRQEKRDGFDADLAALIGLL